MSKDFKKLYIEANDSIKGDMTLIDKAFLRFENEKAGGKKKVLSYSVIGTAAAAVIVICAMIGYPELFKLQSENVGEALTTNEATESTFAENTQTVRTTAQDTADDIDETVEDMIAPSEPSFTNRETAGKKSDNTKSAISDKNEKIIADKNYVNVPEAAKEDAAVENETKAYNTSKTAMIAIDGDSPRMVGTEAAADTGGYSGGGFGASSAKTEDIKDADENGIMTLSVGFEEKLMDREEYFDYIGINTEKLKLPEGMELSIPDNFVILMDGEKIVDDTAFVSASNGDKTFELVMSRVISNSWAIDMYENISPTASKFDDGSMVTYYILKDETSLTATFINMSDEEIIPVVDQLTR